VILAIGDSCFLGISGFFSGLGSGFLMLATDFLSKLLADIF